MANPSSARSTAISLGLHAAAIVALLLLAPTPTSPTVKPTSPLAEAIEIALVDRSPPTHSAGGDLTPAAAATSRPLGSHGTAAPRSIVRAPRPADPYAELAITTEGTYRWRFRVHSM
jgi:hypothetical protein